MSGCFHVNGGEKTVDGWVCDDCGSLIPTGAYCSGEAPAAYGGFDPDALDENSRPIWERRVQDGRAALGLADGNDAETDASDIISSVLTAVLGPSGTFSFTEGDTRYEVHWRGEAILAAEALLDRAFRSWRGDAEDYVEN